MHLYLDLKCRFSHLGAGTSSGDSFNIDINDLNLEALEEFLNSCEMDDTNEDILAELRGSKLQIIPAY